MDNNPSILSHVSIATNDLKRAIAICRSAVPAASVRGASPRVAIAL
ncbi:hypothetical protein [Nostoc sp. C052]|nr:hypothetical protein [Nostoc sp. C052]